MDNAIFFASYNHLLIIALCNSCKCKYILSKSFCQALRNIKNNFYVHIAISEKQCYNSFTEKAVGMKIKEHTKLIGSRIKQRRLELNLTQPYVAEKMGVTASTILRYRMVRLTIRKKWCWKVFRKHSMYP